MSAKTRVVKVFVIEFTLKIVLPFTGILLAFEIFPKLYTFVPFGSIKPTTIAAFDLLTISFKINSLTLSGICLKDGQVMIDLPNQFCLCYYW
jgi:hypothetical protein